MNLTRATLQRGRALLHAGLWGVVASLPWSKRDLWLQHQHEDAEMVQQRRKKCVSYCKILHRNWNLGISVTWGGDSIVTHGLKFRHKALSLCDPPSIPEWQACHGPKGICGYNTSMKMLKWCSNAAKNV